MSIVKLVSNQATKAMPQLKRPTARALENVLPAMGRDMAQFSRQAARDGVVRHLNSAGHLENALHAFQKSHRQELARAASKTLDWSLLGLKKGMQVGKNAHDLGLKYALKASTQIVEKQVFLGEQRQELAMILLGPKARKQVMTTYKAGIERHEGALKWLNKGITSRVDGMVTAGMKRHQDAIRGATPGWRQQFKAWVAGGAERHSRAVGVDGTLSRIMRDLVR
jgi:hypothetical protein